MRSSISAGTRSPSTSSRARSSSWTSCRGRPRASCSGASSETARSSRSSASALDGALPAQPVARRQGFSLQELRLLGVRVPVGLGLLHPADQPLVQLGGHLLDQPLVELARLLVPELVRAAMPSRSANAIGAKTIATTGKDA